MTSLDQQSLTLRQNATSGFIWLFLRTVIQKAISSGGQVIVAWLLVPSDFGIVALAYSLTSLISLIQMANIQDVLIRRHQEYDELASPAFWLASSSGVMALLLHIILAPVGAIIYGDLRVAWLALLLGLLCPLNAPITVGQAKLRIDLRFRFLATISLVAAVSSLLLSIIMAWLNCGPYSIVIPRIAGVGLQAIWIWWVARPPVRWKLDLAKWRTLLVDSGMLFLASIFWTIIAQGDYVTIGLFQSKEIVGIYYFAFNLSMQAMTLFTMQLWEVLVPVLSKLQDTPQRQTLAFLKSARMLAILCVPLTLLQAALAEPVIHILFNIKWQASIPVLQALSIGMTFYAIGAPANSLLCAQGRFRAVMLINLYMCILFLSMVIGCALVTSHYQTYFKQPATAFGIVVALYYAISGIVFIRTAIRNDASGWRDVWRIYAAPLGAGILGLGSVTAVTYRLTFTVVHADWIRVAVISTVGILFYIATIRFLAPTDSLEIYGLLRGVIRRKFGKTPAEIQVSN